MKILHIAPIYTTRANGLRFAIPPLVDSQNKKDNIEAVLLNVLDKKNINFEELNKYNLNLIHYEDFTCIEDIFKINKFDIVIFHGIYHIEYIKIYKYIRMNNIPYIIVPHSCLTRQAQNRKKIKKYIGNKILFNKIIKNANKIHYLTQNEKSESIVTGDYFILGNGTELNKQKEIKKTNSITITYIGRLDIYQKGLDILVNSINNIKNEMINNKCILNIYGSDYQGGKLILDDMIKSYELSEVIKLNGAIYGEEKEHVLNNTDIFITTSRFEGHPMSILEAMSYGIPCIVTKGTNMIDDIKSYNAGWCVKDNICDISDTIIKIILDKSDIDIKGKNAYNLVKENYLWDNISEKSILQYKNIIKK